MMGKGLGTFRNKLRLGGRVLPGGCGTERSPSGKHWSEAKGLISLDF